MMPRKPAVTPALVGGLKFSIGQAVWITKMPAALKDRMTAVAGMITRMGVRFVTIQTATGPKRTAIVEVHHRGYCPACDAAATVDAHSALVCPCCGGDASMPVPDYRQPRWLNEFDDYRAWRARIHLATGCTFRESLEAMCQLRPNPACLIPAGEVDDENEDEAWMTESIQLQKHW